MAHKGIWGHFLQTVAESHRRCTPGQWDGHPLGHSGAHTGILIVSKVYTRD